MKYVDPVIYAASSDARYTANPAVFFRFAPATQRNLAHQRFLPFRLRFDIRIDRRKHSPRSDVVHMILSLPNSTAMVLVSIRNSPLLTQ